MTTHTESGHFACNKAEDRLRSAVARITQGDTANATQEINAARDAIAEAKRHLNLALIQEDTMRNAWRALTESLGGS